MPKRWGCRRRRSSGSPNSGMPCGGSGATWLAPHSFVNRDHGSVERPDFGVRDLRRKAWNRAASRLREMRARRQRASSACPAGSGYLPAPPGPRPKPHPINLAYKAGATRNYSPLARAARMFVAGDACPVRKSRGRARSVPRLSPGSSPMPWHLAPGFRKGAQGPSTVSQTASREAPAQDRCTIPGRARWVPRRSRVPCDRVEGGS